jgi:hypothetical protein
MDDFEKWTTSPSSPIAAGAMWTEQRVLDMRAAFEAGQSAERERCAKIARSYAMLGSEPQASAFASCVREILRG